MKTIKLRMITDLAGPYKESENYIREQISLDRVEFIQSNTYYSKQWSPYPTYLPLGDCTIRLPTL